MDYVQYIQLHTTMKSEKKNEFHIQKQLWLRQDKDS